jgi:hypothetical protein
MTCSDVKDAYMFDGVDVQELEAYFKIVQEAKKIRALDLQVHRRLCIAAYTLQLIYSR